MELVEQDGVDADKFRVFKHHACEHAFGDHEDAGVAALAAVEPHGLPDGLPNVFVDQPGHPACCRPGRNASRFDQNDHAFDLIQQMQRHQRGLARAGRSDQHRRAMGAKRGIKVGQGFGDGKSARRVDDTPGNHAASTVTTLPPAASASA